MKRKIFSVIFASFMMVQTVMADNLGDALTAWKSIYANIQGYQYSEGTTTTISSFDQWANAINEANKSLNDCITLNIREFDSEVYNLNKLKSYDVAISAKGFIDSSFSQVTYYFDYNPNYKMLRVSEDRGLYNRLNLEEKQAFNALNNVVNQIKRNNYTDYDKELAIHDFIATSFTYGPVDVKDVPERAHSIVGLVTDGEGICEAYASTFQLMCKMAGIDSQIITGTLNGIGHMWNIVCIDNEYYHVDVTNDAPNPNNQSKHRYNYFNVTDDALSSTHEWKRNEYPVCDATKYNYQIHNNLVVRSHDDLVKLLTDGLTKSQTYFTFTTDGYIIENPDVIREVLSGKGFSKMSITGEYGKDGIFNVTIE